MKSIRENFIAIQGWMVEDLKLKGNELLVYAIIYGFSQDGENEFTGSLNYLATWCNATKSGIQKNLKSLLDKRLITKKEHYKNDVKYCSYSCIVYNKVIQGIQQSCIGGIQQSCTNNIDNNNINKTIDKCATENLKNDTQCFLKESTQTNKKEKGIVKNLTKKDKILKMIETKCLEYDLTDEAIIEKLQEFYSILLDNKKMVSKQMIEATLNNLAGFSTKEILDTIQMGIDKGWKSLNIEWLKNTQQTTSKRNAHLTCGSTHETREDRQAYFDELNRLDKEGKLNDF